MGSASTSNRSGIVVTSIKTTREQYDAFKAVAAAEHRSVSAHLRYVMEREVRAHAREEKAA